MNKLEVTEFGVGVVATMLANTLKEIDREGECCEVCLNLKKVGDHIWFRAETRWSQKGYPRAISSRALNLSDPLAGSQFSDTLAELVAKVHAKRAEIEAQ